MTWRRVASKWGRPQRLRYTDDVEAAVEAVRVTPEDDEAMTFHAAEGLFVLLKRRHDALAAAETVKLPFSWLDARVPQRAHTRRIYEERDFLERYIAQTLREFRHRPAALATWISLLYRNSPLHLDETRNAVALAVQRWPLPAGVRIGRGPLTDPTDRAGRASCAAHAFNLYSL